MAAGDKNYTAAEIAQALGSTPRWVQLRAEEEKWPALERKGRGGAKLYPFPPLPPEVRRALQAWEVGEAVNGLTASATLPAPVPDDRSMVPAIPAEAPALPDWKVRQALHRADLVKHYLRYAVEKKNGGGTLGAKQDFLAAYNLGLQGAYPQLYQFLGAVTFPTIERWALKLKRGSDPITALASGHGDHRRGRHRLGGERKEVKDFISSEQGKILLAAALSQNQPHLTEAIRTAKTIMACKGVPVEQSDDTYRLFLEDFRDRFNDLWVFYRQGEKALHEQNLPYLERDTDFLEVGDCLVADGHRLNFEILNPFTGKPKRMTLIVFEDWKSNYPAGWEIMPEENTRAISAAFRRACLFLGKFPKAVYIDNGKAFGAKYFSSNLAESGLPGMFERAGAKTIVAWKYHAQSKVVERWFKYLGEFERLLPSYTGTSIEKKPAWRRGGEKLLRRVHEKATGGRIPTLEEAHQLLAAWMDDYAARPQKKSHLAGRSPGQVLEEYFERRREGFDSDLDPGKLRHLMLEATVRTLHRNGVTVPGVKGHYYSEELYGRRHQVVVRYDHHDLRAVWIYGLDGEFICEAPFRPKVHPIAFVTGSPEDQRLVQEQIRQKLGLLKQTQASARAFADAVVVPETRERLKLSGVLGVGVLDVMPPPPAPLVQLPAPGDLEKQLAARERWQEEDREREAAAYWERRRGLRDDERYERDLEDEAQGRELPPEEMAFMRYFEYSPEYQALADYYQEKRLFLSLEVKEAQAR
jgi:putative transposase